MWELKNKSLKKSDFVIFFLIQNSRLAYLQ